MAEIATLGGSEDSVIESFETLYDVHCTLCVYYNANCTSNLYLALWILYFLRVKCTAYITMKILHSEQTWTMSQATQACLCKWIWCGKILAEHTPFLLQFCFVCLRLLGVGLSSVILNLEKFIQPINLMHLPRIKLAREICLG